MKKIFIFVALFFSLFFSIASVSALEGLTSIREYLDDIESVNEIYDKNNNPRYLLYTSKINGYLIYDTYSKCVVEYSEYQNSNPFKTIVDYDKLIYNGTTNYFYSKGNQVYDLYGNSVELKNYIELEVVEKNDSKRLNMNFDYIVPYGNYFKLLDGKTNPFPDNVKGECGYVAEAILLSYYATFYNSDIVCNHYMNYDYVNNSSTDVNQWTRVPCASNEFKNNVLEKYVTGSYSTIPSDIHANIENYLNGVFQKSVDYAKFGMVVTEGNIKDIIKLGIPTLVFGKYTLPDLGDETGNHVVVAYGISDNMIVAHLGYDNMSCVKTNAAYWIFQGGYVYIDSSVFSHKHGAYTSVNGQPYCVSESKYVTPQSSTNRYTMYDSTYHNCICVCGKSNLARHNFVITTKSNITKVAPLKIMKCTQCGYSIPYIG